MISFAGILPNTPFLLERIGKERRETAQKTLLAIDELKKELLAIKPDVFLIISPSASTQENIRLNIRPEYKPTYDQFGDLSNYPTFKPDLHLAALLKESLDQQTLFDVTSLESVTYASTPMILLGDAFSQKPILPLYTSSSSLEEHYRIGKILHGVLTSYEKKVAILCTGNLTHFHATEDESILTLDTTVMNLLEHNSPKLFFQVDENTRQRSHESLMKSLMILLGIFDSVQYQVDILQYENPFELGLLTAQLKA